MLKNYGLFPNHYLTTPALSSDAIANMKKVELEPNSYADRYLVFEKALRGGVFHISKRYSKSNNKYLKSYGTRQESKRVIYLNTNNIYGYAMPNFFKQAVSNGS